MGKFLTTVLGTAAGCIVGTLLIKFCEGYKEDCCCPFSSKKEKDQEIKQNGCGCDKGE